MLKFDLAEVKPSVHNLLVVGLMASIFILAFKYAMSKYPIRGLAEVANSL